jgi:trans-aconitate methyltransferase
MTYNRRVVAVFAPVVWAKARGFEPSLGSHFSGCQSFLDVGCGDGIVTRYLMDAYPHAKFVGLDVLDGRAADIELKIYGGTVFPFPDRHFDCVYAITSLHHCQDEYAVLKEMIRVARKKIVIVEEIYDGRLEKRYLCLHDWVANRLESKSVNIPFHFHTEAEWREMAAAAGGRITVWEAVWPFPFWLTSLLLSWTRHRLVVIEKGP